jgi:plastocyanin
VKRAVVSTLIAGVALLGAAPAVAGSGKPQRKKVEVGDNFYSPSKLTVNKGSTITWVWPDEALDVHDVKLSKGPKGRQEVPIRPRRRRLQVQADAEGPRRLQDRLARSTRR